MDSWLSFKTIEAANFKSKIPKSGLVISIPKKIVRTAVLRNRIRRLIKEAVRLGRRPVLGTAYVFRVVRSPERNPKLSEVQNRMVTGK